MKQYKITLRARGTMVLLALLFFAIICCEGGLLFTLRLRTFVMAPTVGLGYVLFRFLTIAKTQWTIDEVGVKMNWLRQFKGRNEDGLELKWSQIISYKDSFGEVYSIFTIILTNGMSLRFPHGGIFLKDDFSEFDKTFQLILLRHSS